MWMDKLKTYVKDVRDQLVPACQEHFSSWRSGDAAGHSGSQEEIDFGGSLRVRISQKIAEGGYSCVFLGESVEDELSGLPKKYAVKRIACGGKEQRDEAMKEIDVMMRLNHPNILPIRGHAVVPAVGPGPALEHVYMLFDMYDGNVWDVVQSRVQVGRTLKSGEIRSICRQLCLALKAMHDEHLCHRDVKPHNIMLKDVCSYPYGPWSDVSDAPAVLMDFGSVKPDVVVITDRKSALQTQEDAERYTTAPYRAPELWDVPSGCTIDSKVDVWAVGCVLYYSIVGETPFERSSNEAGGSLMLSILNGSYSWPNKNVEVIQEYRSIVEACLTVDPRSRPTIDNVLLMLQGGTLEHQQKHQQKQQHIEHRHSAPVVTQAEIQKNVDVPNLIDL